jgi:hypothetical protein
MRIAVAPRPPVPPRGRGSRAGGADRSFAWPWTPACAGVRFGAGGSFTPPEPYEYGA